jgi:hypothetical protein
MNRIAPIQFFMLAIQKRWADFNKRTNVLKKTKREG